MPNWQQAFPWIALCGLLMAVVSANGAPLGDALRQAPARPVAAGLRLPPGWLPGPVVPGLAQGAVPQGMTSPADGGVLLTSHYFTRGQPSAVVTMDWAEGVATGTYYLEEPDGAPHSGHVGGIAADADSLWVASGAYLYRADIGDLLKSARDQGSAGRLRMRQRFVTEATHEVAFCGVYDGQVWAGEFARGDKYPTDPSHHLTARDGTPRRGWISAYDPAGDFARPERVLSVPDHAQGMAVTGDYVFLSISYGRRYRSAVVVYRNPLADPPHRRVLTSQGDEVPLWFLDGKNLMRTIDLPPQSQNLALIDGQLVVLFESGASKYRFFGGKPLDYIVLLPLTGLP